MKEEYIARAEIASMIGQDSDESKAVLKKVFERYADISDAIYGKDSDAKALIRGNKNTFNILTNKDIIKIVLVTAKYNKSQELVSVMRQRRELKTFVSKDINELIVDLSKLKGECNLSDVLVSAEAFESALKVFDKNSKDSTQSTKAEVDQRRLLDIDRRIAEAKEDLELGLANGELDEATVRAIKGLIITLEESKAEVLSGVAYREEEMFNPELANAAEVLINEANANFQFTDREIKALKYSFKSVGYSIKGGEEKDLKVDNFVAVSRTEFSAVFIFNTILLDIEKRKKVANAFISATGYKQFGDIDDTPYGRQDWWSLSVITDNKKFSSTEWLGDLLYNYKDLGNPRKMWVGAAIENEKFTIDFMDAQNSFTLIGGKSRSGKTCISHSMLIQAIAGGVVPTFMDWKPEGSELYRSLGFYAVQRTATEWLSASKDEGRHLMDLIKALVWLQSVVTVTEYREINNMRDFDKNGLASPENPSMLFVLDELAAFIGDLSSIRVKKPEKEMTDKDKAANEVAKLAETVFKQLNACLRKCATYGIRFMTITQDIMISDTVWNDKAWGGEEGKSFRKAMQNIFWGRGTVRGTDCPISDKTQKTFVNMGLGRFGLEVDGQAKTIRGLRIDNTPSEKLPGMDAASILQGCMEKVGAELNSHRYSTFEDVNNEIIRSDAFRSVIDKVNSAYGTGEVSGEDIEKEEFINDGIASIMGNANMNMKETPSRTDVIEQVNIGEHKIDEDEILMREMFGDGMLIDGGGGGDLDISELGDDSEGEFNYDEISIEPRPICENNQTIATSTVGKDGASVIIDADELKNVQKTYLNSSNSIDCTRCHNGAKNLRDMILVKTPKGQDKMSVLLWKDILDTIEGAGFKGSVVTRLSIYGDKLYVNGMVVNLNGVIGGYHNIRLQDIVQVQQTFKRFKYIREIRVDIDIMDSIQLELGNDALREIFKIQKSLMYLYIANNTDYKMYSRQDIEDMSNNEKMMKLESKMQERRERMQIDAECKYMNVDNRGKRGVGHDLNMNKYAKSSFGTAGKHLFESNKPSLVKGVGWGALGLVVGALGIVGGIVGGGVRSIKEIANISK